MADTRIAQKISQIKGSVSSASAAASGRRCASCEPARHGGLRIESRRSAHHHQQRQPERSEGHAGRPEHRLYGQYQRSDPQREDYGSVVVAYKNGAPVRLRDVAELVSGAENAKLGG